MGNVIATPRLSFGEAIKTCFKKYATFTGRARRSEYWWFGLLNCIPSFLFQQLFSWKMSVKAELESEIGAALFDSEKQQALMDKAQSCDDIFFPCAVIIGIIMLALLLPAIAVAVRRLHDIGKSGWWLLLCLVPFVNFVFAIVLFIWTIKDGTPEANQFGESPKYITQEA